MFRKGLFRRSKQHLRVVPPNKRDAWRLHRVSQGDSFAGLAKRYSAQTASISQINHQELPEAGSLVAIPVAYPGDRVAKPAAGKRSVASRRHATAAAPVATALKQKKAPPKPAAKAAPKKSAPVAHTAVAPKTAGKAPVRHTASLHTPNS